MSKMSKSYVIKYEKENIEETVKKNITMTEVPYYIVEHYIHQPENSSLSFEELEQKFKSCMRGKKSLLLKVADKSKVRPQDYFPDKRDPLSVVGKTDDKVEFGVYTQWYGTGANKNFDKFKNAVKELGYVVEELKEVEELGEMGESKESLNGRNIMILGAPGTGKSNYVREQCKNKKYKRVMFHLEYTYYDFVGGIRPVRDEDGKLTYDFIPGIFTKILCEALEEKACMHYLIIEEMNRANPDAVFGDIFQLLDRKDNGISEYPIDHAEIFTHLSKELGSNYEFEYGDGKVYIPNNLTIIATLNSSDQRANIMDTAFKRRWDPIYMGVEFKNDHDFKDSYVRNLNLTWENFANKVNEFMLSEDNEHLMIMEDKQLGPYFIKEGILDKPEDFAYKVLLYLWDDVFRGDKYRFFNRECRTFSQVVHIFSSNEAHEVFSAEFLNFSGLSKGSQGVKNDAE